MLRKIQVFFIVLVLLAACKTREEEQIAENEQVSQSHADVSPKIAQNGSTSAVASSKSAPPVREVIDMAGRTVLLRQNIERIGTLGSVPMMNTFVESLGAGKKIYNQPSAFHNIYGRWKMHLKFAPQLAHGPHFQSASHELLMENILEADPDVCVTNSRAILDMLDRFNVPAVFVDWSNVERMLGSVKMLGQVLHEEERAATYVEYFKSTMQRLQRLAETIPPAERVRVLYSNPMQFQCPGSLTEEWLETVGARSVTRQFFLEGLKVYDLEDLLQWDPQMIFLTQHGAADDLRSNPLYRGVSAVKNDAIVLVPTVGHMWGGHTVEAPIAACWIMHKLYPDLMPKADLYKEVKFFYKTFFAYEMSDEEIEEIIN